MPDYPLLFIPAQPETMRCKGEARPVRKKYPPRNTQEHAAYVEQCFNAAWNANSEAAEQKLVTSLPAKQGIYLAVKGAAGYELATKSLDSSRDGYSLLNIRSEGDAKARTITATIYIPDTSRVKFAKKIQQYASELTEKGNPRQATLMQGIEELSLAVLNDFWTDNVDDIPQNLPQWCEIWLQDNTSRSAFGRFIAQAETLGIEYNKDVYLHFPEITVALAKIDKSSFHQLLLLSADISECRLAREPAEFFTDLSPREQADWVTEFLEHAEFRPDSQVSVCVLDTGVNNGHPLLAASLSNEDMHTVMPEWGTHDHHGHGTGMAGIALLGDVTKNLATPHAVHVAHCLESCKIRPPQNDLPPELYGLVTSVAVQQAKDAAPQRLRQVCIAVTAPSPFAHRGEPTSWSAAIDALAAGVDADSKLLAIVSAGNIPEDEYSSYPSANLIRMAEDPAQAWNALTIGAYTELDHAEGCEPVASKGQLSPFSRTSCTWKPKWPAKPDVVFEGGNIVCDESGFHGTHEAFSLLTTSHQISRRMFTCFNATSAATAEAAWFAAQVQVAYPNAWPETIRALIVHSADWTPAMRKQFAPIENKTQRTMLKRICGYGVPSLARALYCMNNSLVLVAEREIQPYCYMDDSTGKLKKGMQMHTHELPWPMETLSALGDKRVTMRVTLSYFIEPGPGQRGWKDKYRYASHGLRFDVCGAQENPEEFAKRISRIIEDEEQDDTPRSHASETRDRWDIGSNGRSSGSIHSDFFTSTAADIATCNSIAVFPVVGWWRERTHLKKFASKARYSLIVSLHTEAQDVDIYTPVKVQIDTAIKTPVPIPV